MECKKEFYDFSHYAAFKIAAEYSGTPTKKLLFIGAGAAQHNDRGELVFLNSLKWKQARKFDYILNCSIH